MNNTIKKKIYDNHNGFLRPVFRQVCDSDVKPKKKKARQSLLLYNDERFIDNLNTLNIFIFLISTFLFLWYLLIEL